MPRAKGVKQVAANRKALHDYFVLERFEAGVELFGTEVKSIRAGTLNLKDSYCVVKNDARAAVAVFQGQPREGGARPVQGQKAL